MTSFRFYRYLHLMVDQLADLSEDSDSSHDHFYRRWYDSHDATIDGLMVGATYRF
ncbi:MAG: hypothetical protein H0Z38_03455 [Firmicutes bacterium]|nr:hypothetical protein [Bacillota bacterium]